MTNNVRTSFYDVFHTVLEPSRMSDYDYDPDSPDRRFYSTYMHSLHFNDSITESAILGVEFTSDVWAEILSNIYRITFGVDGSFPVLSTINNVRLENNPLTRSDMLIYRNPAVDYFIHMDFVCSDKRWELNFTQEDIEKLLTILEVDDIEDIYVTYSSDR